MTAPLEGAALFDRVERIVGVMHTMPMGWSLVPAMLEWLRGRERITTLFCGDSSSAEIDLPIFDRVRATGPDLPTALARLVLKVAELEGKA